MYNRKFEIFDALLNSFKSTYGTTYDYLSVMHYGSYAFSINNERTIETKNEKYQNLIGNRATFTSSDMNYINILYSYSQDDADASRCSCSTFDISGFQIQQTSNGLYHSINDSLYNHRIRFYKTIFCEFSISIFQSGISRSKYGCETYLLIRNYIETV